MTPHSSSPPSRYVARGPTDLVAIVPVVLGFHPSDSVVLLTFGAPGAAFHARVDLPLETAEQEEVAELLVGAAVANRVERAAVLLYTDDTEVAHAQSSILLGRLLEQQVEVIEVIRVDDDRWFVFPEDGSPGTPYDLSGHPFTAQGVFEGHVVHRDRGELADTLVGTDEDDAVEVALAATRFADLVHTSIEPGMLRTEARWLQRFVRSHVRETATISTADAGRALVLSSLVDTRDVAWAEITRPTSGSTSTCGATSCAARRGTCCREPARCWRSRPGSTATEPWPGVRSTGAWRSTPTTRWPICVAQLLTGAVPPGVWEPIREDELPVFRDDTAPGRSRAS